MYWWLASKKYDKRYVIYIMSSRYFCLRWKKSCIWTCSCMGPWCWGASMYALQKNSIHIDKQKSNTFIFKIIHSMILILLIASLSQMWISCLWSLLKQKIPVTQPKFKTLKSLFTMLWCSNCSQDQSYKWCAKR